MSGSSAQGSFTRKISPQNGYLGRPAGLTFKSPKGLGEIETSLLEGKRKILHGPGPRAEAVS